MKTCHACGNRKEGKEFYKCDICGKVEDENIPKKLYQEYIRHD